MVEELVAKGRRMARNDMELESAAMLGLARSLREPGAGIGYHVRAMRNAIRDELRSRRKVQTLAIDPPARDGDAMRRMAEAGHAIAIEYLAFDESVSSICSRLGLTRAQAERAIEEGIRWARREL